MLNHYKRIWMVCFLTSLLLGWSTSAFAQAKGVAFNAYYDEAAKQIKYSVSNGNTETYTVSVTATGCITVDGPNDLTGPNDNDAAGVNCVQASSTGEAVLSIYDSQGTLVAKFRFEFNCDSDCGIYATSHVIPTLTEWGLIILGVLLVGLMVYYIAKRRRALPIAA